MVDDEELLAAATAVRAAVGLMKRRMHDESSSGLSLPELSVLSRLDRNGPDTVAGLARWEQITPQAMGATVSGLVTRGLVQRTADPNDGRRQVLLMTDAGTAFVRTVRDETTEHFATVLGKHFTAEEIAAMRHAAPLIERLAQLI